MREREREITIATPFNLSKLFRTLRGRGKTTLWPWGLLPTKILKFSSCIYFYMKKILRGHLGN